MLSSKLRTCYILSLIIAILAMVACIGGIFIQNLYKDVEWIKIAWFGNDLVTLAVAVPMLLVSLFLSYQGSERAQLIWVGMLGYMVYNYAFYLFGAAFNNFFLIYTALFSLSVYALGMALFNMDVEKISKHFSASTPVKSVSLFLMFIAIPLGIVEGIQCIQSILSGQTPQVPSLIFALDLSIVVPNSILAAILLWRHHAWGYILGAIMLLKAFTYGLALCLSTAMAASISAGGTWDPLMPFYLFVAVGGFIGCYVLLSHLKTVSIS
jgi:hypothetical protein